EVAVAKLEPERLGAAEARTQHQRARRANGDDRDHGVLVRTAPDAVAVPGHAVAAVAVVAQARRAERFAELVAVMRVQRLLGRVERRVRERLALLVETQQPWYVDDALIHRPTFRAPRDRIDQVLEELVGGAHPTPAQVDPGALGEHRAAEALERPRFD